MINGAFDIRPDHPAEEFQSNLKNICGTLAAEGMTVRKSTQADLYRIASGQATYLDVLNELRTKYCRRR